MSLDRESVVGRVTGRSVITIERGPVTTFARAVKDDRPLFRRADAAREAGFDDIPVPPTYPIAMGYWGRFDEDQPDDDPSREGNVLMEVIGALMEERGGIMLHGEQEFRYHRPLVVGDRLTHEGRIVDLYEKESKGATMTFVVQEDEYRDPGGDLVLTARLNLIHRA